MKHTKVILFILISSMIAACSVDSSNSNLISDNTSSISGIDIDNNGVRDDVDKYIDSKPDIKIQKQSLKMVSRAMTLAMTSAEPTPPNPAALTNATNSLNMAMACLWNSYPGGDENKMLLEIEKLTVNNKNREKAYRRHSVLTSGAVIKAPRDVICE